MLIPAKSKQLRAKFNDTNGKIVSNEFNTSTSVQCFFFPKNFKGITSQAHAKFYS